MINTAIQEHAQGAKLRGKKRMRIITKGFSSATVPAEGSTHTSSESLERMLEESRLYPEAVPVLALEAPALPRIDEEEDEMEGEGPSQKHQKSIATKSAEVEIVQVGNESEKKERPEVIVTGILTPAMLASRVPHFGEGSFL